MIWTTCTMERVCEEKTSEFYPTIGVVTTKFYGMLEIIWKRDHELAPGRTLKEFVVDKFQCSENLISYTRGDNPMCNA
ncbi:hypothetical protein ACOSQ3_009956 [Xanthoceras sorbifolium]